MATHGHGDTMDTKPVTLSPHLVEACGETAPLYTITPKTSNEALGKIGAALTKEAADQDQVLVGLTKHLDEVRTHVVERAKERARDDGRER